MVLFHVTLKSNLPSILEKGLFPQIGRLSADRGEKVERIYLFPDAESMDTALSSWLGEWYEDRYGPDIALSSLKIALPEGFPVCDGAAPYERYSYQPIPPEYISYFQDK